MENCRVWLLGISQIWIRSSTSFTMVVSQFTPIPTPCLTLPLVSNICHVRAKRDACTTICRQFSSKRRVKTRNLSLFVALDWFVQESHLPIPVLCMPLEHHLTLHHRLGVTLVVRVSIYFIFWNTRCPPSALKLLLRNLGMHEATILLTTLFAEVLWFLAPALNF